MRDTEPARLELLAEVDALLGRLRRWADDAPDWQPAEAVRALVRRLAERVDALRVRLDAPLVVATLGGTGTGKSALVNALLGTDVVRTGRSRPTTTRPTLICRSDLTPEMLGIEPGSVELVQRNLPLLTDLVLIDCPDPDTTEDAESRGTNLARLRQILPLCDVLLVTTTQQKYRSARVADELAAAAAGARLVFVQTHADVDEDVRDDWSGVLADQYVTGQVFLVDCLAGLADAREGGQPRGEFAGLVDLLTRQLSGTAATRIRRANFLDLVDEILASCRQRIDEGMPPVGRLQEAIEQQRTKLAGRLAEQMKTELLTSRRQWESRLLGQVASRWGLSPFALLLRVFHGLGGLIAGSLLWRARTPAQMALWGALTGLRTWKQRRQQQQADQSVDRAVTGCFDQTELRSASLVIDGYTAEAGLPRHPAGMETLTAEADRAAARFVGEVAGQLESVIARLAGRHTGCFTRWRYELLLLAMLGSLLYRLGKNFFYDSWLVEVLGRGERGEVYGLDFYLSAGFWLLLWCLVLLWLFTGRLRRGLRREIDQSASRWNDVGSAAEVFGALEGSCRRVEEFRDELDRLQQHVRQLRSRLALPDGGLGSKKGENGFIDK